MNSLYRLAMLTASVQAAAALLGVLVSIAIARLLGPTGLGTYSAALACVTLLSVLTNSGVPTAIISLIATYRARNDAGHTRASVTWAYVHVVSASACTAIVLAVIVIYGTWIAGSARATYIAALVALPFIGITAIQRGILQGFEHSIAAQIPEGLVRQGTFLLVLCICLPIASESLRTPAVAMSAQLCAMVLTAGCGSWLVSRYANYPRNVEQKYDLGSWYRMSTSLTVGGLATVALAQSPLVSLPLYVSMRDVGLFRVALSLSALMAMHAGILAVPLSPMMARLHANNLRPELQEVLAVAARISVALSLPVAIIYFTVGGFVIENLYGAEYMSARNLLSVLAVAQLISAASGVAGFALTMSGHSWDDTRATVAAALVQIVATSVLVAKVGVLGAALAIVAASTVRSALLIYYVAKRLALNPTIFPVRRVRSRFAA